MPKDLDSYSKVAKNSSANSDPFIWLYEFNLPETADAPFMQYRITSLARQLRFGEDDEGAPLLWYPAPVTNSGITETSKGDLPVMVVSIGSTGYKLAAEIDRRDGLIGARANVRLITLKGGAIPDAGLYFPGEVTSTSINAQGVSVEVSAPNFFRQQFPRDIYSRGTCSRLFGAPECGYDTAAAGALYQSCSGTLAACIARGDDEENRSVPRRHPRNFRAFPGIPRRQ